MNGSKKDLFVLSEELKWCDQKIQDIDHQINTLEKERQELLQHRAEIQNRQKQVSAARFALDHSSSADQFQEISSSSSSSSSSGGVENGLRRWNDHTSFPWSEDLVAKARDVFGITEFRTFQREVLNVTLSGKDCFVIMPTGFGKSLLYQLPAVMTHGRLTLVVSPLLALMEDQVIALRELGIEAKFWSSATTKDDAKDIKAALKYPNPNTPVLNSWEEYPVEQEQEQLEAGCPIQLLYVTPEKVKKDKYFLSLLESLYARDLLGRIVIDEAHCCSQWGHDFRPDYGGLRVLRLQFPEIPILAVTATATPKVVSDVVEILGIRNCAYFRAPFNRSNIFWEVRSPAGTQKQQIEDMVTFISEQQAELKTGVTEGRLKLGRYNRMVSSGIVYCLSRSDVENVAEELTQRGISCAVYHSSISVEAKTRAHQQWLTGQVQAMVATSAFGMGIDKSDVRWVIHHSMPKSLESYYQEAGRAGRDGQPCHCLLYFRPADYGRNSSMVFTSDGYRGKLNSIADYAVGMAKCRRVTMGEYFQQPLTEQDCGGNCDVCRGDFADWKRVDLSPLAIAITRYVEMVNGDDPAQLPQGKKRKKTGRKRMGRKRPTLTLIKLAGNLKARDCPVDLTGVSEELRTILGRMTKLHAQRLLVRMLIGVILTETFLSSAYTVTSYLETDTAGVEALQTGLLSVHLDLPKNTVDGPASKQRAKQRRKSSSNPSSSSSSSPKTPATTKKSVISSSSSKKTKRRRLPPDDESDDDDDDDGGSSVKKKDDTLKQHTLLTAETGKGKPRARKRLKLVSSAQRKTGNKKKKKKKKKTGKGKASESSDEEEDEDDDTPLALQLRQTSASSSSSSSVVKSERKPKIPSSSSSSSSNPFLSISSTSSSSSSARTSSAGKEEDKGTMDWRDDNFYSSLISSAPLPLPEQPGYSGPRLRLAEVLNSRPVSLLEAEEVVEMFPSITSSSSSSPSSSSAAALIIGGGGNGGGNLGKADGSNPIAVLNSVVSPGGPGHHHHHHPSSSPSSSSSSVFQEDYLLLGGRLNHHPPAQLHSNTDPRGFPTVPAMTFPNEAGGGGGEEVIDTTMITNSQFDRSFQEYSTAGTEEEKEHVLSQEYF